MTQPLPIEVARQVLAAQPFSRFLGAELTRFDEIVEIKLPMIDEFKQQNGFAHGGVISYLADNALTFAGGYGLEEPAVVTSEYKINYLRPARGKVLIARAMVISAGQHQAVCRCDIFSVHAGQENLCATALGTIIATNR